MSYHSSKFVVDRVNLLRQLIREKDGNSRFYANDNEEKKNKELNQLVRILRPSNQQANDHSHAIRLRLRQAILNHPNAANEGPLILSRFDKIFESLKKMNPSIHGSVLAFLKPLSFKSLPANIRPMPNALQEERRLNEYNDHHLSLTHSTSLAAPELVEEVQITASKHQPTQSRKSVDLLPSHRNAPIFAPTAAATENTNPAVNNACWVSAEIEKKLLIDLIYVLQVGNFPRNF